MLASISYRLAGTSCLWITHDVLALMQCDCVGVMRAGQLAEFGAPSELLLKADGLFASMHRSCETDLLRESKTPSCQ